MLLVVFFVGFDERFIIRVLVRKREDVDGFELGDMFLVIVLEGYWSE